MAWTLETEAATPAQIARLRKLIAEPTAETYSDDDLNARILEHPVTDKNGESREVQIDYLYRPNPYWIPTYDLNAAAAQVWEEKAAALAGAHDFSTEGSNFSMSQKFDHAMKMARKFKAKSGIKMVEMVPFPHIKRLPSELDSDLTN